jgi:hypothetical protein
MRPPDGRNVRIEDRKVRGYLLSRTRPVGRFKARVFASAGFSDGTADAFVSAIRRLASSGDVSRTEDTPFGRSDTVVLTRDLSEDGLRAGDLGTVVELYAPDGLEVEFVRASGKTKALVTLKRSDVRIVADRDILSVRAS